MSTSILLPVALCLALQAQLLVAQNQAPAASPSASSDLIDKACEQANHKDFCVALLKSDRNSQNADLRGLAYIGLRLAEKNSTVTSVFIKNELNKPEGASDGLYECSERYLSAVELIEDAISSLVSDKYNDVTNFAKAAVADLDSCDMSLNGQGDSASEVTNKNSGIRQLINTALTIAHVAADQHAH